ncbi:MAG: hypothetical protein JW888_09110 [Pirellulales bacterium]|nr:hypothetical protein [Pirellulales bacterium]
MVTLVESPVPILFAGIVAVAILGIVFFNTGRAVFLLAMAGAVALTLAGLGIEYLVVTDREEVETALDALANAMEANDCDAAVACLSPSATETRARARWAFARFRVDEANVSDLKIEVNNLTSPPSAEARFKGLIKVHDRKGEAPYGSALFDFTLDYRKEGDRWLVTGHTEKMANLGGKPKDYD